jgi:methionine synthase II (cobalamin-independent)
MIKPFSTTGIGSLPHLDPVEACRLILDTFDIAFWPQLPGLSFREFMIPQYCEGMPFFRIDAEKQTAWIQKSESDELERFYEGWSEGCRIAMSEDYAKGLHTFARLIQNRKFDLLKGHVTGPLTFSLGLKDAEGKPIYYDEEIREISVMLLKAKTRWQIDLLKAHATNYIIFVDEPILSALGSSAYLGVSQEESLRMIREVTGTIRNEGGLSGIHCCGNADWPFVIRSGADIINFDAYDYVDTVSLYPEEFRGFLEKGGLLAWGIVPTSDAIAGESPESVKRRFHTGIEKLSRHIPERLLLSQILLTPSCGTGSRTIEETLKVFQILMRLKEALT